jgi:glycosyltransferase involved in cell wall biosynthesis
MKISIVTISYNQSKYLKRCIDSIHDQKYKIVQHIIVDPGSSDGSREIIDRYDQKIEKIYIPDESPAEGLNNGFKNANGEIFAFINADDSLLPGSLEFVSNYFENNPLIDVLFGSGYIINGQDLVLRKVSPTIFTPKFYIYGATTLFQQGVFFRKRAFDAVGLFNTKNKTCWDGEFFLKMSIMNLKFSYSNKLLANFRIHEESITGSRKNIIEYKNDQDRIFNDYMGREKTKWDIILIKLYRILKWIYNPYKTIYNFF